MVKQEMVISFSRESLDELESRIRRAIGNPQRTLYLGSAKEVWEAVTVQMAQGTFYMVIDDKAVTHYVKADGLDEYISAGWRQVFVKKV